MMNVEEGANRPGTSSRQSPAMTSTSDRYLWAVLRYNHGPDYFHTLTSNYCQSYEEACRLIREVYVRRSSTLSDWGVEETTDEPKFLKATLSQGMHFHSISTLRILIEDTLVEERQGGSVQQQRATSKEERFGHARQPEHGESNGRGVAGQSSQDSTDSREHAELGRPALRDAEGEEASWLPSHRYVKSRNGTYYRWPDADIPIICWPDLGPEEWGVVDSSSPDQYDHEGTVLDDEAWS